MDLKTFLVTEDLKRSHAERYLTYVDQFHNEVITDVRQELTKNWERVIKELDKRFILSDQEKSELLVVSPKSITHIKLATRPIKITTTRMSKQIEVFPSVQVPLAFSKEQADLIHRELLKVANESFETIAKKWYSVLNFEQKGRMTPWFKIVQDDDEIRFQLSTNGEKEIYKTLYSIRIEYGKRFSKLKTFDRVYLVSLI